MWASDTLIRNLPILAPLVVAALWELAAPRSRLGTLRFERWPSNLAVGCLNALLARLPVVPVFAVIVGVDRDGGLLSRVHPVLGIAAAIVIFDAIAYLRHRVLHIVAPLWRVHRVHHADLHLDFTTAFRFHPFEALLAAGTAWIAIFALGVSPAAVLGYEVVASIFSIMTHVNARLPQRVDAALRWLVVTPDMHRVHHADRFPETHSNFGTVFSVWDRALGTYCLPTVEREALGVGLATFRDPKHLGLLSTLRMPFRYDM